LLIIKIEESIIEKKTLNIDFKELHMIKFSLNKKFVPHDPILLMELRRSIEITTTSTLDSFS
jgi:hypothetical protein